MVSGQDRVVRSSRKGPHKSTEEFHDILGPGHQFREKNGHPLANKSKAWEQPFGCLCKAVQWAGHGYCWDIWSILWQSDSLPQGLSFKDELGFANFHDLVIGLLIFLTTRIWPTTDSGKTWHFILCRGTGNQGNLSLGNLFSPCTRPLWIPWHLACLWRQCFQDCGDKRMGKMASQPCYDSFPAMLW